MFWGVIRINWEFDPSRAVSISKFIASLRFTASMKTSNSSRTRNGENIAFHSASNRQIVEYDFSPLAISTT